MVLIFTLQGFFVWAAPSADDVKRFMVAIEKFDIAYVTASLEKQSALANARGWKDFTALQLAVGAAIMDTREEVAVIELLLRKGADVNAKNEYGDTALHMAVYAKHAEILLHAGGKLSATNKIDETPLHSAVGERDRKDVVLLFLKRGASICARDRSGVTAKDAMRVRYPDVAQMRSIATVACPPKP
jgi:ankyrin repeat protein